LAASGRLTIVTSSEPRYPGIEVILIDAPPDRVVELVRTGEAHCGLGTLRSGEDGISVTPLVRDRLLLFCARDHPLAARDSIRWCDLGGWPLITLTRASGIRLLVEVGFETAENAAACGL
jgi:DNA-binding transcriptional LysR family regulator